MAATKVRPVRLPTTEQYIFEQIIGTGGMGSVYRARDQRTDELVAIKVLSNRVSGNPTVLERLAREFRAAHELEHPNIVRAIAFESGSDMHYVVYELVEGGSLGDQIEKNGRLEESDAIRIITQVAQALHYAHERQVIHRDVKPDNILLLPDGRVKLTDFGLAKDYSNVNDQDLTQAASGLGTPHFMAPEQFADARSAGPRCDVYSLAATFYNLVTGKLPFDAKVPMAILAKKLTGNLLSARSIAPTLSEQAYVTIRAAVDPDPERRPATCLEFFRMLTAPTATSAASLVCTPMPLAAKRETGESRRAWVRFPMQVGTLGVVDTGGYSEEQWPLVVQDASSGGIRILMARRFEPGSALSIEILDTRTKTARRFPARVMRTRQDRAGHWSHGCKFEAPLTNPQLKLLLKMT